MIYVFCNNELNNIISLTHYVDMHYKSFRGNHLNSAFRVVTKKQPMKMKNGVFF